MSVAPPIHKTVSDFRPPYWLRNGHTQSILASLGLRRSYVEDSSRELELASGEVVLCLPGDIRLHAIAAQHHQPKTKRLVVLIHGWEGSANSMYLKSAAGHLFARGFDVVRLHLRDHGPSHDLNEGLFHSCRLEEAVDAVAAIHQMFPIHQLFLGGFSLGGNFSLRIAAKANQANLPLEKVFAVCPVLDPERTMSQLDHGFFAYSWYFLRKWRRSLMEKQRLFPTAYDFGDIDHMTLGELTEHCICRYSEYNDLKTYLQGYAIVGDVLNSITAPTKILIAKDDPIIPSEDVARLARPPNLDIHVTAFGGHCGYVTSLKEPSYADREMAGFFGDI